ncbi:MAG: hypothetical protein ACXV2D_07665 [Halobacteriota archaeon]
MKLKKHLAFFLIITIAVGVLSTAAVTAAPKAAAQTESSSYIPIYYAPGRTYTFDPSQFNQHETQVVDDAHTHFQHTEVSSGGLARAEASFVKGQSGGSYATVGVKMRLYNAPRNPNFGDPNVPGSRWHLFGSSTVKVSLTYLLSATGNDQTKAWLAEVYTPGSADEHVFANGTEPPKTASTTFTSGAGNNWIFMDEDKDTGTFTADIYVVINAGQGGPSDTTSPTPAASHAVAQVYISSISITFDNTPAPTVSPKVTPTPEAKPTSPLAPTPTVPYQGAPQSSPLTSAPSINPLAAPLANVSVLPASSAPEAKQIPEFPLPVAGAAVIVAAAGVYTFLRRRL